MRVAFTILLLLPCFFAVAQVNNFTAKDVQTGDMVSLADYSSKKGVVLIFTSNVCPYAAYYGGRIVQLIADYGDEVQFLLINSHSEAEESEAAMKSKMAAWGIKAPYLSDKDKKVKTVLGARKSPEVFLLKPDKAGFTIYYKGAIDNNPQVANDVKDHYLKRGIENLLAGKGASVAFTRPIGCIIK